MGGKCRQRKHQQSRTQQAESPPQPLHSRPAHLQPGADGLHLKAGAVTGPIPSWDRPRCRRSVIRFLEKDGIGIAENQAGVKQLWLAIRQQELPAGEKMPSGEKRLAISPPVWYCKGKG